MSHDPQAALVHTTTLTKVDVYILPGLAASNYLAPLLESDSRLSIVEIKEKPDRGFTRVWVVGHLMMHYSAKKTRGGVGEDAKLYMQNLIRKFIAANPHVVARTFSHTQATLNEEDCERIEATSHAHENRRIRRLIAKRGGFEP